MLKRLRTNKGPESQESSIMHDVSHPNVVRVIESFTYHKSFYILMEKGIGWIIRRP